MRTFEINCDYKDILEKESVRLGGMMAFIPNANQFFDFDKIYHRKNTALKVLRVKDVDRLCSPTTLNRPAGSIYDHTRIQNIYALEGLAPKVYDVVKLSFNDELHYAQVLEEIKGEHITPNDVDIKRFTSYGKNRGIVSHLDFHENNYKKGKILDFGTMYFDEDFKNYLHKYIKRDGTWIAGVYHTIPELDIPGSRTVTDRVKELKLDEIDFKDKVVLDVGSNLGNMARVYNKLGATRVVGTDVEKFPAVAGQVDLYFNCFNNDYYNIDLNLDIDELCKVSRVKKFDIISFLSVCNYVKFSDKLASLADTVIFEGHAPNTDEHILNWLSPYYNKITKIKDRSDNNNRLAYLARRI